MNILIFSLGIKGLNVVKALANSSLVHSIFCVIGEDDGVDNDFSSELISYCRQQKIGYSLRQNAVYDSNDYDFFWAVGWRWIIPYIPQLKLIIFHDSLLPKYRGFSPLVNALLNKEPAVGVTALLGATEYDRGNILLQKNMEVAYPTCIAIEIERISSIYAELALELLRKLIQNEIEREGVPQEEENATYSLWRDEDDYRINWNERAKDIEHFINCVGQPYRGASALLNGSIVRIRKAQVRSDVKIENRTPGKVIFMEFGLPILVCGEGLLMLEDVRSECGGSLLPLKSFRSKFR